MFKDTCKKVELGFEIVGLDGTVIKHSGPEKVTASFSSTLFFDWMKIEKELSKKTAKQEPIDLQETIKAKLKLVYADLDVDAFVANVDNQVISKLLEYILNGIKMSKKKDNNSN